MLPSPPMNKAMPSHLRNLGAFIHRSMENTAMNINTI